MPFYQISNHMWTYCILQMINHLPAKCPHHQGQTGKSDKIHLPHRIYLCFLFDVLKDTFKNPSSKSTLPPSRRVIKSLLNTPAETASKMI